LDGIDHDAFEGQVALMVLIEFSCGIDPAEVLADPIKPADRIYAA
jgi:hypothetical protein